MGPQQFSSLSSNEEIHSKNLAGNSSNSNSQIQSNNKQSLMKTASYNYGRKKQSSCSNGGPNTTSATTQATLNVHNNFSSQSSV
jgi:hypothetical protein